MTAPTLFDLLSSRFAPVQECIAKYLGPKEIIATSLTAKGFTDFRIFVKETHCNINRYLKRWLKDPHEFRSIQGKCNACISGWGALRFFDRSLPPDDYDGTSLSIVTESKHFEELQAYILSNGYSHSEKNDTATRRHFKTEDKTGHPIVIRLLLCRGSPLVFLCRHSLSTLSMHTITWNKAYALFPYESFIKKEFYLLKDIQAQNDGGKCLARICDLGHTAKSVHLKTGGSGDPLARQRRLGDRFTWTVDLKIDGVRAPDIPDAVIGLSTFCLSVTNNASPRVGLAQPRPSLTYYRMACSNGLSAPVLKYPYAVGQLPDPYNARFVELWRRMTDLTIIEITKVPESQRPPEFQQFLAGTLKMEDLANRCSTIQLPPSWTFHDEEVMRELEDYWGEAQEGAPGS